MLKIFALIKSIEKKHPTMSTLALILAAVTALVIFKTFFGVCIVPTGSMIPTLNIGEIVFVARIWDEGDVERGDIIVFESDSEKLLIKRLVGMPGDTIEIKDGVLYLNGIMQYEPYINEDLPAQDFGPVTVPEGEYFMMGDNRNNSADSRVFGPVDFDRFRFKTLFHYTSMIYGLISNYL